jgi:hypothetical protein
MQAANFAIAGADCRFFDPNYASCQVSVAAMQVMLPRHASNEYFAATGVRLGG